MDLTVYKALFRATPYPYLILDVNLNILGASATYLRSVNRTEEELVGLHIFDAFPENPDDPASTNVAEVKASIARALAKREPDTTPFLRYSVPVGTADGIVFEERYYSAIHTPVMDERGELLCVLQNAIDVTSLYCFDKESQVATLKNTPFSQNQAENFNQAQMHDALTRILSNEREHLRSLFDQAPGFVAVLMGPKHVFELANKAYYQLVGHRDIIGKPVWEALPDVAGQGFEELLDNVYETGKAFTTRAMPIAVQMVPNGPLTQKYVDLVYEPYRDSNGITIGIFAQGYDVTAAVESEAARRASDERLRDGLDAAKMVVWEWNLATDEIEYSDTVGSVMGFTPATMTSASKCVHPDDRERTYSAHKRALAVEGSYEIVIRLIRPDNGKQIWVDSRGRVQYDARRNPTGIRGVTVDVTERYQAELELREAGRHKDEFLAMLAHELRNPLAPITSAAAMLKMVAHNDIRVSRASEVISRQAKHMTALVDDLLDASRVTRGLVELDKQMIEINTVITSAIEQSRPMVAAKKHTLLIQQNNSSFSIVGDRNRLVQIITNLLNNAAKYTPDEGQIVLTVETRNNRLVVEVRDSGIGIDEDLLPHIFDLFTQAKRAPDRSQGGLGIGLALVKTMVNLHGGEITAESQGPGCGSKFTVFLPLGP
jgi:PAS domain S-box-containing protein